MLAAFAAQALRMIVDREPQMIGEVGQALPQLRQLAAAGGEHAYQAVRATQSIERVKGMRNLDRR